MFFLHGLQYSLTPLYFGFFFVGGVIIWEGGDFFGGDFFLGGVIFLFFLFFLQYGTVQYSWKQAARGNICTLIGDTNLDYLRWSTPEDRISRMVENTREEIEVEGFTQVIKGFTRQWRGQADSLVVQCWVNSPERLINATNENRGKSDHNSISVVMKTKDKVSQSQESIRRTWSNFNPASF